MDTTTGKLIVIDGGDGAGKATQTKLLVERLVAEGHQVETMDFPRYENNTFGKLIRRCLDGHHGDFIGTDARIASPLYALDRYESSSELRGWLDAGKVVILDRYVSSNMMHQGAKMRDEAELMEFLEWLDHIEHGVLSIPRPHKIIYLDVPHHVRSILKARAAKEGKHGGRLDQAEKDQAHQIAAEAQARAIVSRLNDWEAVACCEGVELRPIEDIHEDIYRVVSQVLAG